MKYVFLFWIFLCINKESFSQYIYLQQNSYFSIYDTFRKVGVFSIYTLKKENLFNKWNRSKFLCNPQINCKLQKEINKIKNYDNGHLSPNDDFRYDSLAQIESMYYTNCAPQNIILNRGQWKSLEKYGNILTTLYDSINVITGISQDGIFQNEIFIPNYFWKIYVLPNKTKLCYMMKNIKYKKEYWNKSNIKIEKIIKHININDSIIYRYFKNI